ncbi:inosine/uridine-preferring nucleoside hydrolase [Coniochaeta ligniaria NRRL 30616]|uniref:Inosine/uridine-preferring nucleoside hydrolase n=1 Tax=Coniochaeta ligniaria NRRL 30616 TaxID=1408157 RepID=A0A1J7IG89_9PEZI|nr:inosine/uridine-preferring nucleoside hydrolase [Coniochaeta ligniaria NRRL 30616]
MQLFGIFAQLILGTGLLPGRYLPLSVRTKNLIIDTDLFSDVDDAGALLLAATSPSVNLLGVNVNYPSSYSVLAASAFLAHYGHADVSIGARRPLTNATFIDSWSYNLGEFASKVAYHFSGGSLLWGHAEDAWDPVQLYRRCLAEAHNDSVTIASIGFFENLSGLLNSTADEYSDLTGPELIAAKVSELVVMGGDYPSGHEFNFWGDNPLRTAHVINNWPGRMTFSGYSMGLNVTSGSRFMREGPSSDPVMSAYLWYTYNNSRSSWDPLTMLYAMHGLDESFEYANEFGFNHVHANGSNTWVFDASRTDQHWLKLKITREAAEELLDKLYLEGASLGPTDAKIEHLDL